MAASAGALSPAAQAFDSGRSVAPKATPTPEVKKADLEALRQEALAAAEAVGKAAGKAAEGRAAGLEARLQDQARALSRTAQDLEKEQARIARAAEESARLAQALEGLQVRLQALEAQAAALSKESAGAVQAAEAREKRLLAAEKGLINLRVQLEGADTALRDALAAAKAQEADLKERGLKLEQLTDLLGVMKKGIDDNSEEIVEVKQSIKALEPKALSPADGAWWEQALRSPWMAPLAFCLSAVAVGMAAAKK